MRARCNAGKARVTEKVKSGIRRMKEWQEEKVEEVGEYRTAGNVSGFRGGKMKKRDNTVNVLYELTNGIYRIRGRVSFLWCH